MRLTVCEIFQSLDDARTLRRARSCEALTLGTEQLQRIREIGVVGARVVSADERRPVRSAALRTEKLRQTLRERVDHCEALFLRQLQLLLPLDDTIVCH